MSDAPGIMIGVFSLLVFAVIASILFISKSIGGFGRRFDKEQPSSVDFTLWNDKA